MKEIKFLVPLTILLALIVSFSAPTLLAQTASTGALTVTVSDPSGAVIAGASVTVSNAAALSRTAVTNGTGNYTFTLLPPGNYKVSISEQGFSTAEVPGVVVNVSET